ncbi:MBG domain-containing protein, partial [Pediococcus pentosaceus]|uniref:MBG domain-containing protein n=1 Tax=Pediococcus pentosaceus TaxID=1255 RepID=UPI003D780DED
LELPAGMATPQLEQGIDYSVSGPDRNLKNVGSYTVTLTAEGLKKIQDTNKNYDFSKIDPSQVTGNIETTKNNVERLPQTSEASDTIATLIGRYVLAILSTLFGFVVVKKRKNKEE